MAQSIFHVRSRPSSQVSTPKKAPSEHVPTLGTQNLTELTKTRKYCVSRLPALPSHLNIVDGESCNGYCDHLSGYFVAAQKSTISVWNYRSADSAPLAYQFPVEDASEYPPLAILTRPASATSRDPGIVIVNCTSGNVRFYESVQHAPALGLIHSEASELQLPLQVKRGEYVTMAENLEPAGIVVATSWKRCILISLRNHKSRPQLALHELLAPYNSGLISRINIFKGLAKADMDEIVSIKSAAILDDDLSQEIIIQDSVGGFFLFTYQMVSPAGASQIATRPSIRQNILQGIESSIDGYLPGATPNLRIMDLWPLRDIYVCLCLIDDCTITGNEKNLVLVSAKIDDTGVLVCRSHRLTRYTYKFSIDSPQRPRLFIPEPGKTVFVTLGNTIIMTDIDEPYSQPSQIQYYKPRWEDIFRLKLSIEVVGYGYENRATNINPALIALTANNGVLRIERFSESEDIDMDDAQTTQTKTLKSHIEQAVFYADSSAVDFDIVDDFPAETVVEAVFEISSEILHSSSPYLPPFLPSIKDYLTLKVSKYNSLLLFCERNFASLKPRLVPSLVESLEKVEVSMRLWEFISNTDYTSWVETIINESTREKSEDPLRQFFNTGNLDINRVLAGLLEKMTKSNTPIAKLTKLTTDTLYDGVVLNEQKYIIEPIFLEKHWVYETDLLVRAEEIYTKAYCTTNTLSKGEHHSKEYLFEMTKFCDTLYYLVTTAIGIMLRESANEQLSEYTRWYKQRKRAWIDALLDADQVNSAYLLAEKYQDYLSLARILEFDKDRIIPADGADSVQYAALLEKYNHYFLLFGEKFAFELFDFYIKTDKVQALFSDFANNPLLEQYFAFNKERAADVSWIKYLCDLDFPAAADALLSSVNKANENQESRQVKLLLAKLALLASGSTDANSLQEAESGIVVTRVQNRFHEDLARAVHNNLSVLTFQFLRMNLVNSRIGAADTQNVLEEPFERIVSNKPVELNDLINFLTLLKPSLASQNNFADALRVAKHAEDSASYLEHIVWLRLLTLTDDWAVISQTKDKTDEFVKQRIRDTLLFKTLTKASPSSLLSLLDHGVAIRDSDRAATLDGKLLTALKSLVDKYDLATWTKSIIQDAESQYK